jgi:hypothetical protein
LGLEASGACDTSSLWETVSMIATIGGCLTLPVALFGLAYVLDAWARWRRLGRDLVDGRARVFTGERIVTSDDCSLVVGDLLERARFGPERLDLGAEPLADLPPIELALLASGTVVPASAAERLVPHLARPFLADVGPFAPAPPGESRALRPAELAELERHAHELRQLGLVPLATLAYGSMAALGLATGSTWDAPAGAAVPRTLIAAVGVLVGVAALARTLLRRREASALDEARRAGRAIGTPEGEVLPGEIPWRVGQQPAAWRRG